MILSIKRSRLHTVKTSLAGKKFLTFVLGGQEYAIDILKIQEIKGSMGALSITKISDVPPHIRGIFCLHDTIIPVIDLRIFYNLQAEEQLKLNIVIVLNALQKWVGIAVDAVLDVIEFTPEEIKQTPDFFSIIHQDYIQGIGKLNDRLLIVLDVEKLILSEELQLVKHINNFPKDNINGA